jgi:hypothetical protein
MMVYGFRYTVAGHRRHMNVSKISSKRPAIRKRVFLPPRPSDTEGTNWFTGRRDKMMAN